MELCRLRVGPSGKLALKLVCNMGVSENWGSHPRPPECLWERPCGLHWMECGPGGIFKGTCGEMKNRRQYTMIPIIKTPKKGSSFLEVTICVV